MSQSPLTIHLFGPLRVLIQGEPMPRVRTRSVEWLLALLALRHGRAVDRSWLSGTLWPDSEEERALHNLRDMLVHLRKALGPERERLQSPTRDTLTLDLEGAEVDLLIFDAAIKTGDEEDHRHAVEVYAGPLLEGCLEEWVFPERASREQSCLQALETLAEAAEQRQEYAEALSLLQRAKEMDGLRDSTRRGLMRVLASSGDTPAALYAYREYRLLLHEQMNVEPDAETVRLFQQIRAGKFEGKGKREKGKEGERHKVQGEREENKESRKTGKDSSFILHPSSFPTSIPHPLTALIGREQQTREVAQALSRSRLVTLIGGGGVGKTRLAIEVAGEIASYGAQEVAFVALASLTDPVLLPAFVATVLEMRKEATLEPASLVQALSQWLSRHEVLLVLDNCEHLIEAAASLTQTLLERCPNLYILATSRQRMGLVGEIAWRVPSLSSPEIEQLPADPAGAAASALTYPAIQLFVERASSASREFQLTRREEVEAICRICQRLDGIPLAIELAAARVRSLHVEDIHSRLDQRFRLLTGGSPTALPRQQTLRSLIDWSYDLLNEAEKALLCRLSVFSGGWSLEAAEAICTGVEDVLDLLTSLVDKSLVVVEQREGHVRYYLLETVRQYAGEKLTARGEAEAVKKGHQHFYLTLAEEAEPHLQGQEQALWLQRLESEHDNLRTALEAEDRAASLRIVGALWRFWEVRGYFSEGRARLGEALRQTGKAAENIPAWTKALNGAGVLAYDQGDYASARMLQEQSLAIYRELGDTRGIAASLGNLGNVAKEQGDYVVAQTMYAECLTIYQELGGKSGIATSLIALGNAAYDQGDYASARMLQEQSLAIYRELGDKQGIAASLNNLGNIATDQGDYASARMLHEESLVIRRELGDKQGIAHSIINLGKVAHSLDDYASARTLYEESLVIQRELGNKLGIIYSLEALASLAVTQRQTERFVQLSGVAQRLREEIGTPPAPNRQEEYVRLMAFTRQEMGEEPFSTAWADGRAMTLEQAISLALEKQEA